jgi:hypothetical protein
MTKPKHGHHRHAHDHEEEQRAWIKEQLYAEKINSRLRMVAWFVIIVGIVAICGLARNAFVPVAPRLQASDAKLSLPNEAASHVFRGGGYSITTPPLLIGRVVLDADNFVGLKHGQTLTITHENVEALYQFEKNLDEPGSKPETGPKHSSKGSALIEASASASDASSADMQTTKDRARQRVRDAVRHGKIEKPQKCQRCGQITKASLLHGHHKNGYRDPFDVTWLCVHCHNVVDADKIGLSGENNGSAVLTNNQAIEIRRLYASGIPGRRLAIKFGVSQATVSFLVNRKTYPNAEAAAQSLLIHGGQVRPYPVEFQETL